MSERRDMNFLLSPLSRLNFFHLISKKKFEKFELFEGKKNKNAQHKAKKEKESLSYFVFVVLNVLLCFACEKFWDVFNEANYFRSDHVC